MIIAEPKTVFSDHITCISIKGIAKNECPTSLHEVRDAPTHKFSLLLNDGLEPGNAPFGEHWIEWSSPDGMEITFCSCECHRITTKPP